MTMKNVFKKITAGIITLSVMMGMCVIPVGAEEVQGTGIVQDYEIELLRKLNIASEDITADLTADITRGEFSELLTGLLGLAGGGNAIEELYNLGIVHGYGTGSLKETQAITTYEAIKMLVVALGYSTLAEGEGGYPLGYVKLAYDCDLIKGSITNSALTVEQALKLIVDAGNTEMAAMENALIFGEASLGGDTMFYTYFDVVRYQGILTANGYTSLDGVNCITGQVRIAGYTLEKGDTTADDLIGYHVEAYAYDDDMIDEIVVAAPRANYNEVVVFTEGSHPEVEGTLQEIRIKGELDDGTTKRVTVKNYSVLYNGNLYGGLTLDQLRTISADLTFIDNDRDGEYEIIKIEQYETYVIESLDAARYIVYGKYDGAAYTGSVPGHPANYDKKLTLDADNDNVFIYKSADRMGSFADMVEGTAVSVLESTDGSFKKVYILSDAVTGTITGTATRNGRQIVTIDDKQYIITDEYAELSVANKVEAQVGIKVRAVLDLKGNIVDLSIADDGWTYGYVMRMGYDDGVEAFTQIKIYSRTGKAVELTIGERVNIDGRSVKNNITDFLAAGIAQNSASGIKGKRQLVRYKANGDVLSALDTPVYNSAYEDVESLQEGLMGVNGYFSRNGICMYQGTDVLFAGTDETVCFTIPTTPAYQNDERYYSVGTMAATMGNGYNYSGVDSYNLNEAGAAKVVIRNMDSTTNPYATSNVFFIKEVKTVVDAEGEAVYNISAINLANGTEYVRNTSKENPAGDAAHPMMATAQFGDMYQFADKGLGTVGTVAWAAIRSVDYASLIQPRTDIQAAINDTDGLAGSEGTYMASCRTLIGYIAYADDAHVFLTPDSSGTGGTPFYIKGQKVYLADYEAETIEELPVSRVAAYTVDNSPNTKAVVYQRSGGVYAMVIYKNIP